MTRCPSCAEDLGAQVARQRELMARAGVESFPFACPRCGAFMMLDVGEESRLRLLPGGGIATPGLLQAALSDPEIREGLLRHRRGG